MVAQPVLCEPVTEDQPQDTNLPLRVSLFSYGTGEVTSWVILMSHSNVFKHLDFFNL